jgi:hypothetical protein
MERITACSSSDCARCHSTCARVQRRRALRRAWHCPGISRDVLDWVGGHGARHSVGSRAPRRHGRPRNRSACRLDESWQQSMTLTPTTPVAPPRAHLRDARHQPASSKRTGICCSRS